MSSVVENNLPLVTVIALCYNHERFVVECLEHIRAQTYSNTELIIVDDCSKDNSVSIINNWIESHNIVCTFIPHSKNMGICKTLNEALTHAHGEYISMIATDDVWESWKIEHQVSVMLTQPEHVAVVYSDAIQIDESGNQLPKNFIEAHFYGCDIPTGKIFSDLANGNFIPAMSTLIRRQAIESVGGYDERLTFEDYDMWLKLASQYDFIFSPEALSRYRIVSTSMVRTIFVKPTPNHCYTLFLIYNKWIKSGMLNQNQYKKWAHELWEAAYWLYLLNDPRARKCLWNAFYHTRKIRALLQALTISFGISRSAVKKYIH